MFRIEFLRLCKPQATSIIKSSNASFKFRYTSFKQRQRLIPLMICSTTTLALEIRRLSAFSLSVRHFLRGFFLGSIMMTFIPMSQPLKPRSRKITEPAGNWVFSSSAIFLSCFLPECVLPKYLIFLSSAPTMTLFLMV
jgi:hypothetical protein